MANILRPDPARTRSPDIGNVLRPRRNITVGRAAPGGVAPGEGQIGGPGLEQLGQRMFGTKDLSALSQRKLADLVRKING